MFEHKDDKIIPHPVFIQRVLSYVVFALILIAMALGIGVIGYHFFAGLNWVDSLLNASMILGGMGPVDQLTTVAAKVFASMYALFSGLVFIGIMGIVFTPFIHRMLHKFHVDEKDEVATEEN